MSSLSPVIPSIVTPRNKVAFRPSNCPAPTTDLLSFGIGSISFKGWRFVFCLCLLLFDLDDLHRIHHHRRARAVAPVARDVRDFVDHVLSLDHLAEDRMAPVE